MGPRDLRHRAVFSSLAAAGTALRIRWRGGLKLLLANLTVAAAALSFVTLARALWVDDAGEWRRRLAGQPAEQTAPPADGALGLARQALATADRIEGLANGDPQIALECQRLRGSRSTTCADFLKELARRERISSP